MRGGFRARTLVAVCGALMALCNLAGGAALPVMAQTATGLTINGTVDATTGAPLAGAFIVMEGVQTRSDAQGHFTLELQPALQFLATYWAAGYNQQTYVVNSPRGVVLRGDLALPRPVVLISAMRDATYGAVLTHVPLESAAGVHVGRVGGTSAVAPEPALFVTLPDGHVRTFPLRVSGTSFDGMITFSLRGAYQIEVNAPSGLAIFNVTVFHGVAPFPPVASNVRPDPVNAGPARLGLFALKLINRAREAAHLAPLSMNVRLRLAAMAHTHDLVRGGYMLDHPHVGADGSTPMARMLRAGAHVRAVGEAVGEGRTVGITIVELLGSPSHRMILLGDFRWVGIAVLRANGLVVMTIDLAR